MANILLLEDDTSLNRGISLKLEKEGYKVLSAFRVSRDMRLCIRTALCQQGGI